MGWDWEITQKGNNKRYWYFDGTGEYLEGLNIKLNYNIKTKKISNMRIYIINKNVSDLVFKLPEKLSYKVMEKVDRDMMSKKKGWRKPKNMNADKKVHDFIKSFVYAVKKPRLNKIYAVKWKKEEIKYKYLEYDLPQTFYKKIIKIYLK
jgi:hypothetical protein